MQNESRFPAGNRLKGICMLLAKALSGRDSHIMRTSHKRILAASTAAFISAKIYDSKFSYIAHLLYLASESTTVSSGSQPF